MKKIAKWIWDRPPLLCVSLAFLLGVVMEMLGRRSVVEGLGFLLLHPVCFLCNMLVILSTLLLSLLVSRRIFMLCLVSTVWLGLSITNFILLGYRSTPLAAIDFYILKPVFSILKIYLTPLQMVLIVLVFLAVVAGIALIFFKAPRHRALYRSAFISMAMTAAAAFSLIHFCVQADATSTSFANLSEAYKKYGFAYCFTVSFLDTGVSRPQDYTTEAMAGLAQQIKEESEEGRPSSDQREKPADRAEPDPRPNVIFVQLESFIDPNRLDSVSYLENPIPVFSSLKENYTSGYLSVPAIGAGTANTEFEVLSGMNLDYFGPGEYPYTTVLQQNCCESLAYNLKALGYGAHVLHNNTGTFYDRHLVFPHLGFDTFTSLEYMNHVDKNPLGWAKDSILTTEIVKALLSTSGRDFVYAISVQPHGKYPSESLGEQQPVAVFSDALSEEELIPFSYYVNQLYEVDAFVGSLIQTLESFGEPTVLVLYGDHLPAISVAEEHMAQGSLLQTEYVVWDNIGLKKQDRDLEAYQLSSFVLEKIQVQNGLINRFHQSFQDNPRYQEYLEMLEYDMLYGEQAVFGASGGYSPSDMQMGTAPIVLEHCRLLGDALYVFGDRFTPFSRVCIGQKPADTEYISANALKVSSPDLKEGDAISVAQIGEDGFVLSQTEEIPFSPPLSGGAAE